MLAGLENSYLPVKEGDFVYVYQSLRHLLVYTYDTSAQPECGHGVVIMTMNDDFVDGYLLASSLVGVLINGQIGWYAPYEVFRVNSWDAG